MFARKVFVLCLSVLLLSTLAACASTQETKAASADTTAALADLASAGDSVRDALVESVDETIELVRRVAIARGVRNLVLDDANFEKRSPQEITTILATNRTSYTNALDGILDPSLPATAKKELESNKKELLAKNSQNVNDPEVKKIDERIKALDAGSKDALFDEYFESWAQSLRRSAAELRKDGAIKSAEKLEARADATKKISDGVRKGLKRDVPVLLELRDARDSIINNMTGFQNQVTALQKIHGEIDEWVMTDVNVSGVDAAKLLKDHAAAFGLGAPAGGGK